ncbi:MAG: CAP domain-containing protein, partial [Rhizobiales bacterium]|nr:CAP domain-containing protein [Hyphomicrobiales bacterium]
KRLFAANYDARIAGENIAGGFDTIEQAMVGWQNSPGHKKILLKPRVTEIGIGVARNLTTGLETYWVMVLALPDSAPR